MANGQPASMNGSSMMRFRDCRMMSEQSLNKRAKFDDVVGSSRLPSIPLSQIGAGETADVDYYPKGHLDSIIASVEKIVVVVEPEKEINTEIMQFFKEFENAR
jgi:hypothetical protein